MIDYALIEPDPAVPTTQPKASTPKSRAHAFFWTVLTAAALVSITGNATHALLHDTALPAISAAVAIIPPLALLAAVHGVTVLARAHTATRGTRWVATAMTALIATGAFWLSFTALRSLAITAGVPRGEAWLWPLIIEGSMAQATVALLALAHSHHDHDHDHDHDQQRAHTTDRMAADLSEPPNRLERSGGADAQSVPVVAATARTLPLGTEDADHNFSELAARLCARDPARRRDPELVARALAHHYRDGWNPTRIAAELNKSRSSISRILSDATALNARALSTENGFRDQVDLAEASPFSDSATMNAGPLE
jgi:AraC-like DNA-binding protein